MPLGLLKGIDHTATILLENTRRFAAGLPANNALLWGARGMGKSSLVKAAHAEASGAPADSARSRPTAHERETDRDPPRGHRHAARLPRQLKASPHRFIVFCDDLSFDKDDTSYKSLKAVLEGGIEGRPGQRDVLRHLQPPPPDAARHGRERALDRHQSGRGGGGESLAVGPLRPLARLSQRQPGRVPRHGARLRGALRVEARMRRRWTATRSNGRRRAAHARAASPGSSSRISPAAWVTRWISRHWVPGPRMRAPRRLGSRRLRALRR